jgi:hypothetical protein
MRAEAASMPVVPGAIAHGAPPPPPLPYMQQQGHQTATIQHRLEPRQQTIDTDNTFPPDGFVLMAR